MEKRKLVFATNNAHKLREIRNIAGDEWDILSLSDIGCDVDIPETANTLEGNAAIKATYVKEHYGMDCFADDTGLLVDALGGEPGVYSARYAGPGHDSEANMRLLLSRMEDKTDRNAHFSTVIALAMGDELKYFEGSVYGIIERVPRGNGGFGYDPVFTPEGSDITFAEMDEASKNAISHRGRAVSKLMKYLSDI
ncbi:MAG: non-canonical purine NTP diphosphatase [Muribaculaceae bacterium]|nr:non-canonical purine NTP diphosphatase [Muribaculaceae bacterium]